MADVEVVDVAVIEPKLNRVASQLLNMSEREVATAFTTLDAVVVITISSNSISVGYDVVSLPVTVVVVVVAVAEHASSTLQ